jgi:pyruvate dehydrogenase E1 component alpha subunit
MAETTTENGARTDAGEQDVLQGVAPETAMELLQAMLLFRRFEEKAEEAYAIGKIGGFCHLHIGQEGVAAGSIGALRDHRRAARRRLRHLGLP